MNCKAIFGIYIKIDQRTTNCRSDIILIMICLTLGHFKTNYQKTSHYFQYHFCLKHYLFCLLSDGNFALQNWRYVLNVS